jgi:O-antigen/teichoic acid export membrane protein
MTPPDRALTRGSLLARNAALNLVGSALPALAALVAVPILLRALGEVRFSVLVLAWTTLGYFSLFDLGIGRAVTHAVADRIGREQDEEIGTAIWMSLAILAPVGILGTALLFAGSPALASWLGIPPELRAEAVTSFRILAAAVPFAAAAGALRGALEAKQFFGVVNALRVPHGLITFLGPIATLPFSHSLVPAVAILTIGRAALCVAHLIVIAKKIPEFRRATSRWSAGIARSLLSFGGWTQVTYIVSPLMATLDRFVVGAVLGIGMVSYYAAPHELVTKMWLFTIGVLPVFFSALATTARRDPERTAMLFDRLLRLTVAVMFLPALLITLLAPDILRVWLGPLFVARSTAVMQVLAIAVFVNCAGQGAYTLIQGLGRPDITGKYHLGELPVYAFVLWYLLPRYGIMGAAMAWAIRTIADTILLLATCPPLLPESRAAVARIGLWLTGGSTALVASVMVSGTSARFVVAIVAIPLWAAIVWRWLLLSHERTLPLRALTAVWRPEQA